MRWVALDDASDAGGVAGAAATPTASRALLAALLGGVAVWRHWGA